MWKRREIVVGTKMTITSRIVHVATEKDWHHRFELEMKSLFPLTLTVTLSFFLPLWTSPSSSSFLPSTHQSHQNFNFFFDKTRSKKREGYSSFCCNEDDVKVFVNFGNQTCKILLSPLPSQTITVATPPNQWVHNTEYYEYFSLSPTLSPGKWYGKISHDGFFQDILPPPPQLCDCQYATSPRFPPILDTFLSSSSPSWWWRPILTRTTTTTRMMMASSHPSSSPTLLPHATTPLFWVVFAIRASSIFHPVGICRYVRVNKVISWSKHQCAIDLGDTPADMYRESNDACGSPGMITFQKMESFDVYVHIHIIHTVRSKFAWVRLIDPSSIYSTYYSKAGVTLYHKFKVTVTCHSQWSSKYMYVCMIPGTSLGIAESQDIIHTFSLCMNRVG